jgi:hypothetical protein
MLSKKIASCLHLDEIQTHNCSVASNCHLINFQVQHFTMRLTDGGWRILISTCTTYNADIWVQLGISGPRKIQGRYITPLTVVASCLHLQEIPTHNSSCIYLCYLRAALHLEAGPILLEADCKKFQPFLGWRPASTTHYNKIITGTNFPICKGLRAKKLGRFNKSSIIQRI